MYEDSNYNLFCTYGNFYIDVGIGILLNLHLQSHEICSAINLTSFLFVPILNALTSMAFVSFETH